MSDSVNIGRGDEAAFRQSVSKVDAHRYACEARGHSTSVKRLQKFLRLLVHRESPFASCIPHGAAA